MDDRMIVGIDLAKRVMQVCVLDHSGKIVVEKRLSRDRLASIMAAFPGSVVAMEAAVAPITGAGSLARQVTRLACCRPVW